MEPSAMVPGRERRSAATDGGLPPTTEERDGTMRIGLTSIYVDDQDQAERFYTQVLGFQVKTSAAYSPGERWLSVVSPRSPTGSSWCCTWPTSRRGRSSRPALGVAVSLLLDATIVRSVLMPATLAILGDRAWWLPRWLGWLPRWLGWLPRLTIEPPAAPAAPVPAAAPGTEAGLPSR